MKRVIVVPAEGPVREVNIDSDEEISTLIGGGLQLLPAKMKYRRLVIYVDEEGERKHMRDPKSISANATLTNASQWPYPIYGNAVISASDDEGGTADVPSEMTVDNWTTFILHTDFDRM